MATQGRVLTDFLFPVWPLKKKVGMYKKAFVIGFLTKYLIKNLYQSVTFLL